MCDVNWSQTPVTWISFCMTGSFGGTSGAILIGMEAPPCREGGIPRQKWTKPWGSGGAKERSHSRIFPIQETLNAREKNLAPSIPVALSYLFS